MASTNSVASLLANIRRYKWTFSVNANPASISCMGTSMEDAREQILSILTQIDNLADERKRIDAEIDAIIDSKVDDRWEKVTQLRSSLKDKHPQVEDLNGCFCPRLGDYGHQMEIEQWKKVDGYNVSQETTLGTFISTTDPLFEQVCAATFFSCLDG
jgi:hypothetical protein